MLVTQSEVLMLLLLLCGCGPSANFGPDSVGVTIVSGWTTRSSGGSSCSFHLYQGSARMNHAYSTAAVVSSQSLSKMQCQPSSSSPPPPRPLTRIIPSSSRRISSRFVASDDTTTTTTTTTTKLRSSNSSPEDFSAPAPFPDDLSPLTTVGMVLQEIASLRDIMLTPGYNGCMDDINFEDRLNKGGSISRSFQELDIAWTAMEEWDQIIEAVEDTTNTVTQRIVKSDNSMTGISTINDRNCHELARLLQVALFERVTDQLKDMSQIEGCTSVGPPSSIPNFISMQRSFQSTIEDLDAFADCL